MPLEMGSRAEFGRHVWRISQSGQFVWVDLGLNQDDAAVDWQRGSGDLNAGGYLLFTGSCTAGECAQCGGHEWRPCEGRNIF